MTSATTVFDLLTLVLWEPLAYPGQYVHLDLVTSAPREPFVSIWSGLFIDLMHLIIFLNTKFLNTIFLSSFILVTNVSFSVFSRDTTVKVWDLEKGEETCSFGGHTETVTSVLILSPEETAALSEWSLEDTR